MRPFAVDLFTGLHGWAEGLVAEGWRVRGYDIEDMCAATGQARAEHIELIIQDVLALNGADLVDENGVWPDLIVSSSPCTAYSYMAMPWTRAKAKAEAIRADETGEARRLLNALFDAQFRIQREASAAKGERIPMVVENVRGAQEWVGRARWHYGSYYLWGDVPAIMPEPLDSRKNPGFRFDGSGGSFQSESVARHVDEGRKHHGDWFRDPTCPTRQGGQMKPPARVSEHPPAEGRKGAGAGAVWFDQNTSSLPSKSPRRKAASAAIAKIPFALSSWIGKVYHPRGETT